eukprot:7714129-Pyramimonas_sp.AAC.1
MIGFGCKRARGNRALSWPRAAQLAELNEMTRLLSNIGRQPPYRARPQRVGAHRLGANRLADDHIQLILREP